MSTQSETSASTDYQQYQQRLFFILLRWVNVCFVAGAAVNSLWFVQDFWGTLAQNSVILLVPLIGWWCLRMACQGRMRRAVRIFLGSLMTSLAGITFLVGQAFILNVTMGLMMLVLLATFLELPHLAVRWGVTGVVLHTLALVLRMLLPFGRFDGSLMDLVALSVFPAVVTLFVALLGRHSAGRLFEGLTESEAVRRELARTNQALEKEIHERVQVEKVLAQQAEELARSNVELEQFAYVTSHDLREPLRKIRSYTELLERRYRGQLDPRADQYIDYVVDGCDRMQALIADLLTYSRAGREDLSLAEADFEMVLKQVLNDLEVAIRENGAMITHGPLPSVVADPEQMAQVLRNLVENALKFRGPETPAVHVSALRKGDEWVLSVRDDGIGIDPQFSERIFQIFQRLHSQSEYPGTGIGLAISKKIVERHGGRIWVESQPGEGSTFHFTVPIGLSP